MRGRGRCWSDADQPSPGTSAALMGSGYPAAGAEVRAFMPLPLPTTTCEPQRRRLPEAAATGRGEPGGCLRTTLHTAGQRILPQRGLGATSPGAPHPVTGSHCPVTGKLLPLFSQDQRDGPHLSGPPPCHKFLRFPLLSPKLKQVRASLGSALCFLHK